MPSKDFKGQGSRRKAKGKKEKGLASRDAAKLKSEMETLTNPLGNNPQAVSVECRRGTDAKRRKNRLAAAVVSLLLAGSAGMLLGGGVLHPAVRPLTPQLIAEADRMLERVGATREEFDVRA